MRLIVEHGLNSVPNNRRPLVYSVTCFQDIPSRYQPLLTNDAPDDSSRGLAQTLQTG